MVIVLIKKIKMRLLILVNFFLIWILVNVVIIEMKIKGIIIICNNVM